MNQQFYMLSEEGIKVLAQQITENLKKVLTRVENSTEPSFLTIDEASKIIKLTKPTVYGLVHQNKIPFIKKGKRLYFVKAELLDWITSGKQISKSEAEINADAYLYNNQLL